MIITTIDETLFPHCVKHIQHLGRHSAMGVGVFHCCGGEDSSSRKTSRKSRKKDSDKNDKLEQGTSSSAGTRTNMDPKLYMNSAKTIQLLTDCGELKRFDKHTIDDEQLERDFQIHANILASLENPMGT